MTKHSHERLMEQVFEDAASRRQRQDSTLHQEINACLYEQLSAQIEVSIPDPAQQEWDAAEARRVAD